MTQHPHPEREPSQPDQQKKSPQHPNFSSAIKAMRSRVEALLAEPDPRMKQRMRRVAELFEQGLQKEQCVGYHGTSWEALEHLIRHGHMPTGTQSEGSHVWKVGDFHFIPTAGHFPDLPLDAMKESDAREHVSDYAGMAAEEHFLYRALGLDMGKPDDVQVVEALKSFAMAPEKKRQAAAKKSGMDTKNLQSLLQHARKRKGIILGISKDILTRSPRMGDDFERDVCVNLPDGLDLSMISGIEPIGEEEIELLEKIQQTVENDAS